MSKSTSKATEWEPYKFDPPKGKTIHPTECGELIDVHHVAHAAHACNIIADGHIKAGLINDESRLNKTRLCVAWVSANTWGPGSIYGNVQFSFKWKDLITDKRIYWVEAMPNYKPPAYRLLVTSRDLNHFKNLTPYNPKTDQGPLRKSGGTWYWNSTYTSEFMFEGDIDLAQCKSIRFISHHPNICRLYGSSCSDKNTHKTKLEARVLAFILGRRLHTVNHTLVSDSGKTGSVLTFDAEGAVSSLYLALGGRAKRFTGSLRKKHSRHSVLKGSLALYGNGQHDEAQALIALLQSKDIFEKALTEVVREHFSVPNFKFE